MGYILDLRRIVGTRVILITGALVLLFDENNRLLMQKRADNGLWGMPGGSMEPGETFEACAMRETAEETGLICQELEYWRHFSGKELFITYPNGDQAYIATIAFICRKWNGKMQVQKEEVTRQQFFALEEIPDQLDPISRVILDAYRSKMK